MYTEWQNGDMSPFIQRLTTIYATSMGKLLQINALLLGMLGICWLDCKSYAFADGG